MTDMKQIFRIFTLIAVAVLTAGQAWADGAIAIGTTEGGSLACYSDAACTSTTKITSAEPGSTVYVRAVADGIHTLVGMTASNISVEETSGSGVAEARSVTRAPGIGLAVAVSAVEGKLGLYSFTMPSDGWNVCVKATFPDKAKTTATLAYQDWNGTALASAEKTAGQVYILDGTESILGTPGTSATNMTDVWYVCQTSATANSGAGLAYGDRYADNAVLTCADYCRVHLILKDGSKMTVESTHRGICDNNEHGAALSIYAQSDGTDMGVLTVSGTTAIEMTNGLTINGGKLTATSTNGQGFRVNYGDIAIHGGEVTGIGSNTQSIFAYDGDVTITGGIVSADQGIMSTEQSGNGGHLTISGGEVTANSGNLWGSVSVNITSGKIEADEITCSDNNIILGWTNVDDYIKVNEFYSCVTTVDGKRFVAYDTESGTAATAIVSGTAHKTAAADDDFAITDIEGKWLRPLAGNYVATTNSGVAFSGYISTFDVIDDNDPTDAFPGTMTHYYIYKAGDDVTLNSGEDGVMIDISGLPDGTTYNASTNTFTMPSTDVTLTMRRYITSVPYIGWDATEKQPIDDATTAEGMKVYILEGDETTLGTENAETWFIVRNTNTDATVNGGIDLAYSTPIEICSDVHLILADGAEMDVTTESISHSGIYYTDYDHDNLSIYGQSAQSGTLSVAGKHGGIEVAGINVYGGIVNGVFVKGSKPGDPAAGSGIVTVRKLNIYGGTVNGTIVCNGDFTIYGGELCAVTTEQDYGINNQGSIFFKGGKLTASGLTAGINAGDIILDWSDPADFLYVNNYALSGEVHVIEGKRFVANTVGGTATNEVLTPVAIIAGDPDNNNTVSVEAIDGKKLLPIDGYCITTASDGISIGTLSGTTFIAATPDFSIGTTPYYIYKASTQEAPVTVTLSYDGTDFVTVGGLPEGTTLNAVANQPMQRSFAMPAQDVALTATAVTGLTASGTYTYSGSAQTPAINLGESAFEATNYTVTGITPKEGSNSQLTDGSAVNAGEYSLAITGLGQYIGTASVDFTIGKADYEGTTTASAKVVCNQVTTGKMLTLPALPDGASYAATGIVGGETVALIEGTPTVSGTTLTFSTTSQVDGTSTTITIGVTGATNYNDYDVVVTVTTQAKEETVITINESITKTYGDADFTLSPSVPATAGSGVWTWASANTDVATISESGTVTILKAGEATIKVVFESETHLGEVSVKLTVDPKTLGIVWNTDGLVYDGTPKAPTAHLSGVKSGDDCSVEISVEGDHAKAGAGYTATASLSGTKVGNYTLPEDKKSKVFSISPKPVTVSSTGITAENKIYDGKTSATLSGSFAFDDGTIIAGDNVTITGGTGAFADKNVGTGKTVVISGVTLGGTDAGNYTLSAQPTGVTGSITKKTVTVTSGISASNKTYDGTTTATLSGTNTIISGKVDGDALSVSATGAFADKDAGSDKTVNISSITLTGNDKDNYALATIGNQATTSANISKKDLSITADDKNVSYRDPAPNYTASYSGFVSGESESNLSGSLSFSCSYTSSSNTGTYSIMPSGYTSSNYNISYNNGTLTVSGATIDYTGGSITLDENGYDITLDEGTGSANPLPSGTIDDLDYLDYSRTLTAPGTGEGDVKIGGEAANLYTVCLPTAPMITGTAVTYYTLSSVEGTTLKFTEIDGSPAAFTPYLVAVTGNSDVVVSCSNVSFYTNQAISNTTVNGFTFTGTLAGLSNAAARATAGSGNVTYILQDDAKWGKVVSGSVYLPPFRAYIVGPGLAAGARELSSNFDDGNATAIERIVTTDRDGTEHWYDMNGRRIERPTTKGVYILNGRKEVIK
jgi:hypothetical protein